MGDVSIPPDLGNLAEEYEFLRELGRGGMAAVYLARDLELDRDVAIKVIRAAYAQDDEVVARFAREARLLAKLDHPNIVSIYAVRRITKEKVALVMQHVPGPTLRQVVGIAGALPVELVIRILRDVGGALAYAHRRGIVHRDVKPENIFLESGTARALLSDFGVARSIEADTLVTITGSAIGTPTYMSPEQIEGLAVDGRSDLYSLGVVAWEMLSGKRLWEGDGIYTVLYKHKHESLPSLAEMRQDIPVALLSAVEGALVKDREGRWQSVDVFLERLPHEDSVAPAARPAPPLATPAAPARAEESDTPTLRFRRPETDDEPEPIAPESIAAASAAAAPLAEPVPIPEPVPVPRSEPEPARQPDYEVFPASASAATPPPAEPVARPPRRPANRRAKPRSTPRTPRAQTSGRSMRDLIVPIALAAVGAVAIAGAVADRRASDPFARLDTARVSTRGGTVAPATPVRRDSVPLTRAPEPARAAPAAASTTPPASATPPRATPVPTRTARATTPAATAASRAPRSVAARTHEDSLALCSSSAASAQRACLFAHLAESDVELNRVYGELVAALRDRAGAAAPDSVQRLRAAQRAWIVERDVECRRRTRAVEGVLWAPVRARCLGELSSERAQVLAAQLNRVKS